MSDSESSNISISSEEDLTSCIRPVPSDAEVLVSGQPSYLHTGCHQYRNNMLAHLLHSPSGNTEMNTSLKPFYDPSEH